MHNAKSKSSHEEFYVGKGLQTPLLGRKASSNLNLSHKAEGLISHSKEVLIPLQILEKTKAELEYLRWE